ncbi:unnamed protein product [Alternaria alternata]
MSTEKVTKSNTTTESIERYSVFTKVEKWSIVALASYAAWFSTLSSFIYFPAIPTLSQDLGVSVNKIDFTVTTYMAVATFSPMLVADAAEILGRRAVYTLTLTIYFVANLAIALSKTYLALVVLRALQALAISGTFSIAYGVVVDIASPAERGSFAALCDNGPEHWPSLRRKPHVGCRLDLDLLVLVHRVWILPRSDVAVPPRDISEDRGQRFDPTDEAFGTTSAHYAPLEC